MTEQPSARTPAELVIPDMVQTSAAINPGNSGGALVSPADQTIKDGRVTDPGLASPGITSRTVVSQTGEPVGAGAVAVTGGGPADQAGIRPGGVITRLGATPGRSAEALASVLTTLQPGQQVEAGYLRDGKSTTTTVTLGTL